ncbi:MAG: hypothetical protein RR528_01650 [Angelakisella sp.]
MAKKNTPATTSISETGGKMNTNSIGNKIEKANGTVLENKRIEKGLGLSENIKHTKSSSFIFFLFCHALQHCGWL